jgi:hypothetical protein
MIYRLSVFLKEDFDIEKIGWTLLALFHDQKIDTNHAVCKPPMVEVITPRELRTYWLDYNSALTASIGLNKLSPVRAINVSSIIPTESAMRPELIFSQHLREPISIADVAELALSDQLRHRNESLDVVLPL